MASSTGTPKPSCAEVTHEHVGAGHARDQVGVAHRAGERDGVVQAQLVDEAVQRAGVGGTTGRPTTSSVAAGSWCAAGDQERHDGELDPLFGARRPTLTQRAPAAGAAADVRAASRRRCDPARHHGGRGDDRGAARSRPRAARPR